MSGRSGSEALTMTDDQKQWTIAKGRMMDAMRNLGFPEALGDELVVDEMLSICSNIVRWKDKKELEQANAKYNEILYFGLENMPDEEE